jgi:quinoprotein glucose dehydrogenase
MYNRDLRGTRFSPLKQITARNVGGLRQVWSHPLGQDSTAGGISGGTEVTPLVVNGVLYMPTAKSVVALEADTGKEIWRYALATGVPSRRGVAYWPGDRNNPPRIIFTSGRKMVGLNANTGKLDPGFGKEGEADIGVAWDAAPVVFRNFLLLGANTPESPIKGPAGDTRAFDARTGAKLWDFHSVPRPGETGHETWEGDTWKDRTGVNNWGFSMTVDPERELLYTVFGGPAANYYGGDRVGDNLFANCVVALEISTGKLKWYFQVVHHDLWDYDLPPPATLIDITVKGQKIAALAQATKSGYLYILDRTTGKPVFGVTETPVPASTVPGEKSSPTQPIPVKPPALARTSYKAEDIVTAADTNEEHAKFCQSIVDRSGGPLYNEGPFTPYLYRAPGAPPRMTILFPGSVGGVNWGGSAHDPTSGYVFVNSMDEASVGWIENSARLPYDRNSIFGPTSRFQWSEATPSGNISKSGEKAWPCQKPPWGRLIAVNANTGDFAWQVPLGITEELPTAKQKTGRLNMGGPIATAGGLVFIGASNDRRFRAFDSKSGKELWVVKLRTSAHAVPITYLGKNGKQYVAVAAGGASALDDPPQPGTEELLVFALP